MEIQFYCHLEFGGYIYFFVNFTLLWTTRDSTIEYTLELYMYNSSKGFSAADDTCYIHCCILQLEEILLQQFQSQVHDQLVLLSSGK